MQQYIGRFTVSQLIIRGLLNLKWNKYITTVCRALHFVKQLAKLINKSSTVIRKTTFICMPQKVCTRPSRWYASAAQC